MTALEYMRKYGAFEVEDQTYNVHMETLSDEELKDSEIKEGTNEVRQRRQKYRRNG